MTMLLGAMIYLFILFIYLLIVVSCVQCQSIKCYCQSHIYLRYWYHCRVSSLETNSPVGSLIGLLSCCCCRFRWWRCGIRGGGSGGFWCCCCFCCRSCSCCCTSVTDSMVSEVVNSFNQPFQLWFLLDGKVQLDESLRVFRRVEQR